MSSFALPCANRSWALSKATSFTLPMASASGALKVGVGSGLPCLRAGSSDSQAIFVLGVSLRGTLGRLSSAWSVEKSRTRLTGFRHQYFGQTRLNELAAGTTLCYGGDPQRGHLSAHAPQGRRASSRSHRVRGLRLAEMAIMDDKQSAPATPRVSAHTSPLSRTPTVVPLGNSSRVRRGRRLTTPRAHPEDTRTSTPPTY